MCGIFTSACQKRQQVASPQPWQTFTPFDEVLAKPEYSNSIAQAEQDLPTDEWVEKPFKCNASRAKREAAVADQMLAEIRPRLKSMNITNLVKSFKLIPHPLGILTNDFHGVAEDLYARGNGCIVYEIKSRSTNELQFFISWETMQRRFTKAQGYPLSLRDQLDEILQDLREGLTNNPTN